MKISTRHFGEVDIDEKKMVNFEKGVFGFEGVKKFVVLFDDEPNNPFAWLQAVEERDVCLPMINPMVWYPMYSPEVDDEIIQSIGKLTQKDLDVYTIVVIPEDIQKMTTNLRAPIIINRETKKGIQAVVNDEEYDVRHNLYEQIQKLKEAGE